MKRNLFLVFFILITLFSVVPIFAAWCDCWTDSSKTTRCSQTPAGSCPLCDAYCEFSGFECGNGEWGTCSSVGNNPRNIRSKMTIRVPKIIIRNLVEGKSKDDTKKFEKKIINQIAPNHGFSSGKNT